MRARAPDVTCGNGGSVVYYVRMHGTANDDACTVRIDWGYMREDDWEAEV